ncbi:hypothetical protein K439DRAFT_349536 [Ramaria rubella]|nr:hypothetical protein K439DRAFT_349536 [Ramaria rubella]
MFTERTSEKEDADDQFLIDTWPVGLAALDALNDIKTTHIVNPIPLMSGEGLVAPEHYKETLVGTVIECHVNISHWYIKESNRDTYNASEDESPC